ncbi:MAG: photosystem II protein PsbQ [Leptolyngbyaceae cyanobacterium CRU_2_3]|nr:photosystem II protein PsbQ [Leptolyngbyaceae cyanobacterium CRU_2_3]
MGRFRAILTWCLVLFTALLVSCGSPTSVAKGPLYTDTQLEQIQKSATDIRDLRDRLIELPPLIQSQDWVDVGSFIHGPLGELRARMARLSRTLAPDAQASALKSAKDVFGHLTAIDEAAQTRDIQKALKNYNEALKDFDAFFNLIPS